MNVSSFHPKAHIRLFLLLSLPQRHVMLDSVEKMALNMALKDQHPRLFNELPTLSLISFSNCIIYFPDYIFYLTFVIPTVCVFVHYHFQVSCVLLLWSLVLIHVYYCYHSLQWFPHFVKNLQQCLQIMEYFLGIKIQKQFEANKLERQFVQQRYVDYITKCRTFWSFLFSILHQESPRGKGVYSRQDIVCSIP